MCEPNIDDELSSLTYRQLQVKCKEGDLKAGGKREDLIRRLQKNIMYERLQTDVVKKENQEPSPSLPIDHLVCPITKKIPLDPVRGEDDEVYERNAIEKYIATNSRQKGAIEQVKSPSKGHFMGTRLVPAPSHERQVQALVDHGAIAGDIISEWKEKADLLKDAVSGNAEAMYQVGTNHLKGLNGFKQDEKMAFDWFHKSYEAGYLLAARRLGDAHCVWNWHDHPDNLSPLKGMTYYAMAVGESDLAAYKLGMAYAKGHKGLPKDKNQAKFLLKKVVAKEGRLEKVNGTALKKAQKQIEELHRK